jgi:hypothetical protein
MEWMCSELARTTGRFAWLQSAVTALVLHPKKDDRFRLGVLILFGRRQNALGELILVLDQVSKMLTRPENREVADRALLTFCTTYQVADDAEKTRISLS